MNQFLGFLTAFFVVGWAVRWYLRQGSVPAAIEWKPPREGGVLPAVTKWETLTDVTVENSLKEPRAIEGSAPRMFEYEPADEVERRLETLVSETDEPVHTPSEMIESLEAREAPPGEITGGTGAAAADTGSSKTFQESEETQELIVGFCARCRDKRHVLNPVRTQTKKGKAAIRGSCEVCGAGMFVFISGER